jgi:4'-phosphopantetheinyl transferase
VSAVTVAVIDLAAAAGQLERCLTVLDARERDRAARFLRPADRVRYAASHAALRLILGEALDRPPEALCLAADAGGRPHLSGALSGALDFNLSHSGELALVGLSSIGAIGVDVELIRPLDDALRIARAHFAADEAAALAALPTHDVNSAFFGLWTRKEAFVKALGTGLSLPLDRFSVSLPPAPARVLRAVAGSDWTLSEIDAGPGYAATVAVRAAGATVDRRVYPGDWPDRLG